MLQKFVTALLIGSSAISAQMRRLVQLDLDALQNTDINFEALNQDLESILTDNNIINLATNMVQTRQIDESAVERLMNNPSITAIAQKFENGEYGDLEELQKGLAAAGFPVNPEDIEFDSSSSNSESSSSNSSNSEWLSDIVNDWSLLTLLINYRDHNFLIFDKMIIHKKA